MHDPCCVNNKLDAFFMSRSSREICRVKKDIYVSELVRSFSSQADAQEKFNKICDAETSNVKRDNKKLPLTTND